MKAKELIVKRISPNHAKKIIEKNHYSGKQTGLSKIHFGIFYKRFLCGALSFGGSQFRKRTIQLVENTQDGEYLELNRMALEETLPKNSESRVLSICLKLLKKIKPKLKWVLSYADGCQSGDGTIYRACNFKLTSISKNKNIILLPDGRKIFTQSLCEHTTRNYQDMIKKGFTKYREYLNSCYPGWAPLEGYQFRYIYFYDGNEQFYKKKFLNYNDIKQNMKMYKGKKMR